MNRRFHKPFFVILIVRPPQEDCDIYPSEENTDITDEGADQKTASEENFSESQISSEEALQPTEVKEENSPADEKPHQSDLSYYKARYYHPTLGRFLQRDPLGYVDGYNLYAYTANNPINWIDPLGLEKAIKRELENQLRINVWRPSDAITDPNNPLNNEFVSYVDRGFNLEPKVSVEYDANGMPTRITYDYRNTSSGPINTAAAFVAKPFADFARGVDQRTAAGLFAQDGRFLEAHSFDSLGRQSQAQGAGTMALTLAGGATAGSAPALARGLSSGINAAERAAYSGYVTAVTTVATPVGQKLIEFGYGYYGPPDPPRTVSEAIGSALNYGVMINDEYQFIPTK